MNAPQPNVTPLRRTPLAELKRARVEAPWRVLLYGTPGIGKTTFAAQMPDPIFICAERNGADEHDVARYPDPLETWADVLEAVRRMTDEPHGFKTLVIDTVGDLEPLCWAAVCAKDSKCNGSIEEFGGGFQKGYAAAIDEWRALLSALERLQDRRGMNVVVLAHAERREFKSPDTENYDRYEPALHKKAAALLVKWSKEVLFAQERMATAKLDGAKGKAKAASLGARILRTRYSPAYDAKNRHNLPDPLPLSFQEFEASMAAQQVASPLELKLAISVKLEQLDDAELKKKVADFVAKAGDNPTELALADNRLTALLAERNKE